jgi:hypothetical protein
MFKKTFIYSVISGLLVLLNTGIVDHANAQKTGHVYVETKVGIDGKLLPATIDCTDQTYDIKGDGLAWMSIYQERKSRESILQEYINLCSANKGSVYRFYIKLMEGDIDNRLYDVWWQSPEGLQVQKDLGRLMESRTWMERNQEENMVESRTWMERNQERREEMNESFWERRERREREQRNEEMRKLEEAGRNLNYDTIEGRRAGNDRWRRKRGVNCFGALPLLETLECNP